MQIVSFSFPEILPFCVVGGPLSWSEGPLYLGIQPAVNAPTTSCIEQQVAETLQRVGMNFLLNLVCCGLSFGRILCVLNLYILIQKNQVIQSDRNEWLWFGVGECCRRAQIVNKTAHYCTCTWT